MIHLQVDVAFFRANAGDAFKILNKTTCLCTNKSECTKNWTKSVGFLLTSERSRWEVKRQ